MNKELVIILSGANVTSGGPLTIFNDALHSLSQNPGCKIIAIVGNRELFYAGDNVEFIEIKNYKKFIFLKFYYEYIYYSKVSKKLQPDLWISLNDFTPNISAANVFTYFHNASIFFDIKWSDFIFSRRVIFQKMYYRIFLGFNIKKNRKFIVQQNWIAERISNIFQLPIHKLLLFKPDGANENSLTGSVIYEAEKQNDNFVIFYPTRAYGYKNIEVICEAIKLLSVKHNVKNIELRITIGENENTYSKYLKTKFHDISITWLGLISKAEVNKHYSEAAVLVFPSRLETWGLPLSEFARYSKPIFAIDLEYAHETLEGYPYVAFFGSNDIDRLIGLLKSLIDGERIEYFVGKKVSSNIESIHSWDELLHLGEVKN